jgi:uncharacterized protein with GYD domain
MARFLFEATYTSEGLKGLLAAGAKSRVQAVEDMVSSLGGSVVSLDYANGGVDVFLICEVPDDDAAIALTMVVGASGALADIRIVKLFPAEQIEAASARNPSYVPPGG